MDLLNHFFLGFTFLFLIVLKLSKYKNYHYEQIIVTSGVPQGDHLSSILFCMYINDISDVISHSKILLLADDAKIFKKH